MKAIIDPRVSVDYVSGWKDSQIPILKTYPNSGRVCEVNSDNDIFPVAEPLYWTDCPDNCVADQFWCDLSTNVISPIIDAPRPPAEDQPTTTGTQTV